MCCDRKFSVRHSSDLPFVQLPLHLFPLFIKFYILSAFHYFIVHPFFFRMHLCTYCLFQCFMEAFNTSSPTLFFFKTTLFPCVLPVCLPFRSVLVRVFPSLFLRSLSLQFILLLLLASWLQQCTCQSLSAWSGCLWQCECVLHGLSDWVSSLHTKGQ